MLNFIGIGAQKCGTTWLYDKLSQHPDVSFPAGKEVHFWDMQHSQGVQWYRALFDVADDRLHGDITPAYGILPQSLIAEVFCELPDVRLIYLIRNPIERAWSSAKMAVMRAEMRVDEASDQWFIDHFRSAGSLAAVTQTRLDRHYCQYSTKCMTVRYTPSPSTSKRIYRHG